MSEVLTVQSVQVVNEFPEVFLEDTPRITADIEIEFGILNRVWY